jgi:hypothetical protein
MPKTACLIKFDCIILACIDVIAMIASQNRVSKLLKSHR